jgi:hypothetical protein
MSIMGEDLKFIDAILGLQEANQFSILSLELEYFYASKLALFPYIILHYGCYVVYKIWRQSMVFSWL